MSWTLDTSHSLIGAPLRSPRHHVMTAARRSEVPNKMRFPGDVGGDVGGDGGGGRAGGQPASQLLSHEPPKKPSHDPSHAVLHTRDWICVRPRPTSMLWSCRCLRARTFIPPGAKGGHGGDRMMAMGAEHLVPLPSHRQRSARQRLHNRRSKYRTQQPRAAAASPPSAQRRRKPAECHALTPNPSIRNARTAIQL